MIIVTWQTAPTEWHVGRIIGHCPMEEPTTGVKRCHAVIIDDNGDFHDVWIGRLKEMVDTRDKDMKKLIRKFQEKHYGEPQT